VTAEEEIRYTEIIDGILATADLETVTRKKIRVGLQNALGGKDLNEQKVVDPLAIPACCLCVQAARAPKTARHANLLLPELTTNFHLC
jgi:upstream activation factor subunit UAF30